MSSASTGTLAELLGTQKKPRASRARPRGNGARPGWGAGLGAPAITLPPHCGAARAQEGRPMASAGRGGYTQKREAIASLRPNLEPSYGGTKMAQAH
jgi:hypothetical protein